MGGKKKSKKNQKSKLLYLILTVIILIIAAVWYVCGKPTIVVSESGVLFQQTERPLVNKFRAASGTGESIFFGKSGNTGAKTEATENYTVGEALKDTERTDNAGDTGASANDTATAALSATGTSGSNPALDQGHAENSPLFWGNPSDSISDTTAAKNYLMEKPQFTICYNSDTLNPNWVAWHLAASDLGEADRADTFRPDTELPAGWYAVRKNDYKFTYYGFDRGHICPSADRTASTEDNSMTFLMTNMVPQAPDNNRIVWVALEKFEREQVLAGKEAYIFAGPYGKGGTGDKGYFEEIPISLKDGTELSITVPAYTWKIIIFLPEGDDDFSRIADEAEVLAVCVPNEKGCGKNGSWQQYLCSINYIEENTGYNFFELLDDELEENIESRIMSEAVQ